MRELLAQTAEIQREDQLGSLLAMLRDGSKDNPPRGEFPLRYQAVSGLVALGAVAVEPLCLALRDQDSYTRRFAAEALARIGDARAVIPLVAALRESEMYVQRYVAGALAGVGDTQAVEPLRTALDQPRLAREALHALQAVLTRAAGSVPGDQLQRVASLADRCYALIEVPDTDGGYLAWNEVEQWLDCRPVKQLAGQELERRGPLYITGGRHNDDGSETAARQLLLDQPELEFFYIIWLAYSSGSGGYNTFHSLVTDPQSCQAAIQRLCAEQKAISAREIAELEELPEDDMPYDLALPDGCSVSLCIVLPDKQHYVRIQGQHWNNYGQSHHPALIPDIFDVAYYSDKVRHGDYSRYSVKS
ncbi:MAG: HEAT repeat domain-containing protein [Anaerolineales bacterium]|nr:HEAT repeat domain-containing protein [Anaerolineales bacterium]